MAYKFGKNIWSALKQQANNDVWPIVDSGAPTNGTSGTGAGFAGIGSTYTDVVTGIIYVNIGTKASPTWKGNAPIAATIGLGNVGIAKATYDFAVDGGAVSTITPAGPTLPTKSIILGGTIDITTTLTSGGAATISVGTSAGSSSASLKALTAVASWTAGQMAIVPIFTAATFLKLTAAGAITTSIAVAALTAGKFDVNLVYVVGN